MDLSEQITSGTDASNEPPAVPDDEQSSVDTAPAPQEEETIKWGPILYEIVETVLLAVVIWLLVNFTTARYVVEGQSMEPNLHTGQFLIVSRLAYMDFDNLFDLGDPQRGDIVVFDFPGNPSDDYVKRVIGLPGETVEITQEGQILIEGTPIDEPYLGSDNELNYRGRLGTWKVPDGSYFVVGDNRNSSSDSRSWGMLEEQYIVGKAWLSYWPPKHWEFIPHYDYSSP